MKEQSSTVNNDTPLALLLQKDASSLRDLVDKLDFEAKAAQGFMQLLTDAKRPGATEADLTREGADYLIGFWLKIQMDLDRTFDAVQKHLDAELAVQREGNLPVATN